MSESVEEKFWNSLSTEDQKTFLEIEGKYLTPTPETCALLPWFKEMLDDEIKAVKDYAYGSQKFHSHLPFFNAFASLSKDESRHKELIQTMLEILTPKCAGIEIKK